MVPTVSRDFRFSPVYKGLHHKQTNKKRTYRNKFAFFVNVSYFLNCTLVTKEIGDVCTQATTNMNVININQQNKVALNTALWDFCRRVSIGWTNIIVCQVVLSRLRDTTKTIPLFTKPLIPYWWVYQRSKTEWPSVSAAFLKSRKMSQGNVSLSRDIYWHRVGDVQN